MRMVVVMLVGAMVLVIVVMLIGAMVLVIVVMPASGQLKHSEAQARDDQNAADDRVLSALHG